MTTKKLDISMRGELVQDAESHVMLLRREYPGLEMSLEQKPHFGWTLRAVGPHGSLHMLLPNPLRGETVTAACQLVCRSNVEARRGPTAATVFKNRASAVAAQRLTDEDSIDKEGANG